MGERGLRRVEYDETSTVRVTRDFMGDPKGMLDELFAEDEPGGA